MEGSIALFQLFFPTQPIKKSTRNEGGHMIELGKRLKELRRENVLTMEEIAKVIGVAKSSYAGYESEFRKPSLDKLVRVAQHYDVSVDYLLGLTDERNCFNEEQDSMGNLRFSKHERELISAFVSLLTRKFPAFNHTKQS